MKYKDDDKTKGFTVIPNEMYNKARDLDARKSVRRILSWILKEVVSETKKKVGDEWVTPAEGFAPKTWIARDLDISTKSVDRDLKDLRDRKIVTIEKREKTFKVMEDVDIFGKTFQEEKYYTRSTTYIKVNRNTDKWILDRPPRKKQGAGN